ncbi:hypothetical protein EDB85DRAFT_326197 [Lactarius pseudohatsudake]|nr:hypothetical protein EDB85DRAFT_326197 [Lactarius pseudohatsudake]
MGDGIQAKPNQGKPTPADSSSIMHDVVTTLITILTTLSRMQRRPAFGLVFLLNHTASLRANVLKPRAPVRQILSRPALDALNSNFCTTKATRTSPARAGARGGQGEVGRGGKGGDGEVHAVLRSARRDQGAAPARARAGRRRGTASVAGGRGGGAGRAEPTAVHAENARGVQ